ncbi:TetR/AcrR family transcriptional regulator [Streptomyces sp. NPDC059255]|uniref:TetR/AcrR family transcriptional regulator n=1 Tax=Streptomyces sp. NPDC059255 TaxID=3346793 RepID=UPI0036BA489A
MTRRPGLRERKKQETRTALSRAAWELLADEGLAAVTPENVAARVGVSGNTFRNYFGSREEAIVEAVIPRAGSIADALRARPAGEPVWDSLAEVLPGEVTAMVGSHADVVVLMRVAQENPAILAQHLTAVEAAKRLLAETIAERSGGDGLSSRLLVEAAGAAIRASVETWAAGDGSAGLAGLVRESVAQLRAGLPAGTRTLAALPPASGPGHGSGAGA